MKYLNYIRDKFSLTGLFSVETSKSKKMSINITIGKLRPYEIFIYLICSIIFSIFIIFTFFNPIASSFLKFTINGVPVNDFNSNNLDIRINGIPITEISPEDMEKYIQSDNLDIIVNGIPINDINLEDIKKYISINNPDYKQNTTQKTTIMTLVNIPICIILFCLAYALIKRFIILKTKVSKPKNINIYNRDLPANLTPAHARLLVHDVIDDKTLATTILDLIDRGYLILESGTKNNLFTNDSNELIIRVSDKNQDELFKYEKHIIKWFFENDKTSKTELHKKLNNNNENPSEQLCIFQGLVLISFPLNKYYKKHTSKIKRLIYNALSMSFFLTCLLFLFTRIPRNLTILIVSNFLPIFGLANQIFSSPTYLLNGLGVETKDSYLDLKNYLEEFSLIKEKTSEMIVIWNYYLSYSVALGIKGIASKEIRNFFGDAIYNLNSNSPYNDDKEVNTLINSIDEDIQEAKILYSKR